MPQVAFDAASGPMINRPAELKLTTRALNQARNAVQRMVQQHGGYIAELSVSATAGEARTLRASLRVPVE